MLVRSAISRESGRFCIYQLLVIMFSTVIFSYIEKSTKEDWVLYDSFKKSQNIVMKFADASPFPSFVLDPTGKILACNKSGKGLIKSSLPRDSRAFCFGDLVHPTNKEAVLGMAKNATKEGMYRVEALLLVDYGTYWFNVVDTYEPFALLIEGLAWKGTKCAVVTCRNVHDSKQAHRAVLASALGTQQRTKKVCGIFSLTNPPT